MEHLKFAEDVYQWLAARRNAYAEDKHLHNAAVYDELAARAEEIQAELGCSIHTPEFIENRGLSPDDPGFYKHPHALQALADYITGLERSRPQEI